MWRPPFTTFMLCFVSIASTSPVGGQVFPDLPNLTRKLQSGITAERRNARDDLAISLDRIPRDQLAPAVDALVRALDDKDYRVQLGIAVALGKTKVRWRATDHEGALQKLYSLYNRAEDETLKRSLDDALNNAEGMYWDCIQDYNNDVISDLPRTKDCFRRVYSDFGRSRYAENANFYLGQYLTRAYRLGHPNGRALVVESNGVFDEFINKSRAGAFVKSEWLEDGLFYRALNDSLLGDKKGAVTQLAQMEKLVSDEQQVYVYQFIFSRERNAIVDAYFPAKKLAGITRTYVERLPTIDRFDAAELKALLSTE
ncbi:hypothetical protein AA309_05420 [Microvirga vignae]|uniref:Uncharacterized protein n=1 Tax=Microvirga vignae TaxID=1225564 RepID=A0A0H1RFV1_9HYPH|nr:HEAT repeat domain-containing protein [Microvirga vignae]KLK93924.1 hypothetical protein AA309_05420 [Microvirga vignae]